MNRKTFTLLFTRVAASILLCSTAFAAPVSVTPAPATPESAQSLAYLSKRVGENPYSLLKTQPLRRRLMALLGPEFPTFLGNLDPATDLAEQNGILHIEGNAPHHGGEEEAVLLIDVPNDTLEVFIRHKTTIVKGWAENKRSVVIPHDVMGFMKEWPRQQLAEALARIVQASRAAGTTAGSPSSTRVSAPTKTQDLCRPGAPCDEVNSFAANITDFRTSSTDRYKVVTATIRITNKLDRPLILGLVQRSGVGIDDQGNRYLVDGENNVRGIGMITSTIDPKFSLQPGESSDARIEFVLKMEHNQIYGTSWELTLTLREIDQIGRAHV